MYSPPVKVYITGKISGLPEDRARSYFQNAANLLASHGFTPVNPFTIHPDCDNACESGLRFDNGIYKHTWQCYMKSDIKALVDCDAIFALLNVDTSEGAQVELNLADALGIKRIHKDSDGELYW